MDDAGRILWKCRRGSLELDLILSNFCQREWQNLSLEEKQTFEKLLEEDDILLTAWIFEGKAPENPSFAKLLRKGVKS